MYKTLKKTVVYENQWIRVFEDAVEFPDKSTGLYGYVERKDAGSIIIPITAEGKLILLREWRYPIRDWTFCFPFGGMHEGEDMLSAAKRELSEETGYTADHWETIGSFSIDPGLNTQKTTVFIARALSKGERQLESSEIHDVVEFHREEIEERMRKGLMTNGWLLATLSLYDTWIKTAA